MYKTTRRPARMHECNTNHPARPCCWAARHRELDAMAAADPTHTCALPPVDYATSSAARLARMDAEKAARQAAMIAWRT